MNTVHVVHIITDDIHKVLLHVRMLYNFHIKPTVIRTYVPGCNRGIVDWYLFIIDTITKFDKQNEGQLSPSVQWMIIQTSNPTEPRAHEVTGYE